MNARMAASVTGRPGDAAAAPAGSESSVRKVSQCLLHNCSRTNEPKGTCDLMGTAALWKLLDWQYCLFLLIITSNLPFSAQHVNQACLEPAVKKDVSVCTGTRATTSLESVSVCQGGEGNSVTKVQICS